MISAQGTAVAERCQERALALNDLEDSHRMGSPPLCWPHPPSPQGQPSTQDPWPRGAASFRAMVSVSSSPDSQLLPCLSWSVPCQDLVSHRWHSTLQAWQPRGSLNNLQEKGLSGTG